MQLIQEGKEPDEFWSLLGGKKEYFKDNPGTVRPRLWKCSNSKGYFKVLFFLS